jgi:hypothetical protein
MQFLIINFEKFNIYFFKYYIYYIFEKNFFLKLILNIYFFFFCYSFGRTIIYRTPYE